MIGYILLSISAICMITSLILTIIERIKKDIIDFDEKGTIKKFLIAGWTLWIIAGIIIYLL